MLNQKCSHHPEFIITYFSECECECNCQCNCERNCEQVDLLMQFQNAANNS